LVNMSAASAWQVNLAGKWSDFSPQDSALIEKGYQDGKQQFQIQSRGQLYNIDLRGEQWKQINVASGKPRNIRLWPPPPVLDDRAMTNDPGDTAAAGPPAGMPVPQMRRGATASVTPPSSAERLKIFVWLSGDWQPVSSQQDRAIKEALVRGETRFEISDGSFQFTVDTTGKDGWVQIGKTGRRRKMKCEDPGPAAIAPSGGMGIAAAASVPPIAAPSGGVGGGIPAPHAGAVGSSALVSAVPTAGRPTRKPAEDASVVGLVAVLRNEWKAMTDGKARMTKTDVTTSWKKSLGPIGLQDPELLEACANDLFSKFDVGRTNMIEEFEFLHYRLLENQAPSSHAISQINEKLSGWIRVEKTVLQRLFDLFVKSGGSGEDPRLTAAGMRGAAAAWLREAGKITSRAVHGYLQDLIKNEDMLEDDVTVTYYDFMNHMLGRRKAAVKLYMYDLLNGKTWWLSPILLGQQFEGIWHTGVVVHDKEYWFGGSIFESLPGTTPFGVPTKIVDLPEPDRLEYTMRTRDDLWNFIRRDLADEFTTANYDVLTHNCNHFSDAVSQFLINEHIPDEVIKQPEMVMNTWTATALRPLLNRWLGTFGEETDGEGGRSASDTSTADEWATLGDDCLVLYEYEVGWTCIARIINKDGELCKLQWLEVRGRHLQYEDDVNRTLITPLKSAARKKGSAAGGGGGGMFGACSSPTTA